MEKFTNDELLEVLYPQLRETKELTTKQKVVLGQLIIYNGLEKVKKDGYFYRSNKDLCNDCNIQEKTLITSVRKLESLGFIERKKGTRPSNASEYRLNEKLIKDYCETTAADYSKNETENYSKQIVEMTNRIKELEITVKKLVKRITVIEGKNYSTELDIEIDKEKDLLNNNILNKTSFNNILEESNHKLETIDSEEKSLSEAQLVSNEIPTEVLISTYELENFNEQTDTDKPSGINEETITDDETYVPTDEEKDVWKGCLRLINPYLAKMQTVTSTMLVDGIKDEIVSIAKEYFNSIDGVTDWVTTEFSKRVAEHTSARLSELEEMNKEKISEQLQQSRRYAEFY